MLQLKKKNKIKKRINLRAYFYLICYNKKLANMWKRNITKIVPNKSYRNRDLVHTVLAF
jgi:hypothetical protein